jgi:hypothetical protein
MEDAIKDVLKMARMDRDQSFRSAARADRLLKQLVERGLMLVLQTAM